MRKATRIVCLMFPLIRQEHDQNRTEDESLCRTAKKKKRLKERSSGSSSMQIFHVYMIIKK